MIGIIDYGLGNLHAFITLYKRLGISAQTVNTSNQLENSSRLILPGVGAFDNAMELLNNSGMLPKIEELVLEEKVPILGVCVGMQILGTKSDEGQLPGLNWISGKVKSFPSFSDSQPLSTPHMGWNEVRFSNSKNVLGYELKDDSRFYFLHSYYFEPDVKENIVATSKYGFPFAAAISNGNIYGVQFHPEKSHQWGLKLLRNFAEIKC